MQKEVKEKALPRYELTERAYIDDTLLEAGVEIEFEGLPGAHMKPLNAAARAQVAQHPPQSMNPIDRLTTIGPTAELALGYVS